MQILRGLYQVGGSLNGISWTGFDASYQDSNVYVLDTGEELLLFDCGCGDTLEQIFQNMRYWGLDPARIGACLLTHPHLDHAGAAHILARRGVQLYAHEETADAIGCADERCCGYLYHKTFIPCTVSHRLKDGDIVKCGSVEVRAEHYPGHTAGCTAYILEHEGKTLVFSGDIIGTLLDGHFGWSGSIDFDKKKYLESLKRFARFDSDMMLPGHGMIYFHEPRRRVEQALNEALVQWR